VPSPQAEARRRPPSRSAAAKPPNFKYAIKSASDCGVIAASRPSGINEMPVLFNDATSLRSTDFVMFPAIFSVRLALVSVAMTP
jgi:hypothetical protein